MRFYSRSLCRAGEYTSEALVARMKLAQQTISQMRSEALPLMSWSRAWLLAKEIYYRRCADCGSSASIRNSGGDVSDINNNSSGGGGNAAVAWWYLTQTNGLTVSHACGALRSSRPLLNRSSGGMLQYTRPSHFVWGYTHADMHRLARPRPWWENFMILVCLVLFVLASSIVYYFFNRLYNKYKPSGNDILVNQVVDQLVFTRPDLAVAAVRMSMHHALSGVQTPFAAPMVAPEYARAEAETLMDFVLQLQEDQPMYTIPDIWAIVTAKSLARLGGPMIEVRRGRPDPKDDDGNFLGRADRDELLVYTKSLVPENVRDVLNLKRVLSRQGYALNEIIAMIVGVRNIGFHESSGIHTSEEITPKMLRTSEGGEQTEETIKTPESKQKCTLDPYVFGGEYFDLLLDYNWKRGVFSRSGPFTCKETDRRRQVVYLDPFSEQELDREKKKFIARQRAMKAMERANKKRAEATEKATAAGLSADSSEEQHHNDSSQQVSAPGGEETTSADAGSSSSSILPQAMKKWFGRSGEAQTIPGIWVNKKGDLIKYDDDNEELIGQYDDEEKQQKGEVYVADAHVPKESPCPNISMREMDIMLLDDALCYGWLHRFSANEIQFYETFGKVLEHVQGLGYNSNLLYVP